MLILSIKGQLHDMEDEADPEYIERLKEDLGRFEQLKLRVHDEVLQIKDNKYKVLLMEYYIRNRTWEQTAMALNAKSVKNTRENLREAALKAFAAKFPQYFT